MFINCVHITFNLLFIISAKTLQFDVPVTVHFILVSRCDLLVTESIQLTGSFPIYGVYHDKITN